MPLYLNNPIADHPLNAGLVSWWLPLPNNQGGSRLFDLKGGNHGVLTNGPTWTAGPNGFAAVQFDGSDDYIQSPAIVAPQTLSFECYARLNSTTDQTLLAVTNGGATPGQFSQLLRLGSGVAAYCFDGGTNLAASGSLSLSAGVWYHVVGTWANGSAQTVYLNGASRATSAIGTLFTGWGAGPFISTGVAASFGAGSSAFGGTIGFGKWYSRTLSASEVAALYDQTLRGHPDTLRRWTPRVWSFGLVVAPELQAQDGSNLLDQRGKVLHSQGAIVKRAGQRIGAMVPGTRQWTPQRRR